MVVVPLLVAAYRLLCCGGCVCVQDNSSGISQFIYFGLINSALVRLQCTWYSSPSDSADHDPLLRTLTVQHQHPERDIVKFGNFHNPLNIATQKFTRKKCKNPQENTWRRLVSQIILLEFVEGKICNRKFRPHTVDYSQTLAIHQPYILLSAGLIDFRGSYD